MLSQSASDGKRWRITTHDIVAFARWIIRSWARTSPGDIPASWRLETIGTIMTTSKPSLHRASTNMISPRIGRRNDELAPHDQPRPTIHSTPVARP